MPSDVGKKAEGHTLKRVPGSGAWLGSKGDFSGAAFLIEQKSTQAGSYGIKLELLDKITREARQVGKAPAFHIVFTDGTGRARRNGGWVMVREADWEEMTSEPDEQEHPAPAG